MHVLKTVFFYSIIPYTTTVFMVRSKFPTGRIKVLYKGDQTHPLKVPGGTQLQP